MYRVLYIKCNENIFTEIQFVLAKYVLNVSCMIQTAELMFWYHIIISDLSYYDTSKCKSYSDGTFKLMNMCVCSTLTQNHVSVFLFCLIR